MLTENEITKVTKDRINLDRAGCCCDNCDDSDELSAEPQAE